MREEAGHQTGEVVVLGGLGNFEHIPVIDRNSPASAQALFRKMVKGDVLSPGRILGKAAGESKVEGEITWHEELND